jgi:hypothetical protein
MTVVLFESAAPSPLSASQISPVVASIMRSEMRAWKVRVFCW